MKAIFLNTTFIGLALLVSSLVGGEVCYEYAPKGYTLVNAWSDAQGKIHSKTLPTSQYRFMLVKPDKQLDRLNSHTFVLVDKTTSKPVIEHNTMECYPFRGTTGGYECQGECDGVHVIVAEDGRLRSRVGMLFGETVDALGGDWELEWNIPGSLLSARAVPALQPSPGSRDIPSMWMKPTPANMRRLRLSPIDTSVTDTKRCATSRGSVNLIELIAKSPQTPAPN